MGLENSLPPSMATAASPVDRTAGVRFVVDVMLGTLARWLRILGYDTFYSNRITDSEILKLAETEDRTVLTRDRRLAARKGLRKCILIENDHLGDQLRLVLEDTGRTFRPADLLSRCLDCNSVLLDVEKETVKDRVPPYVFKTQHQFRTCPRCAKLYWRGTHRERMMKRLNELLQLSRIESKRQIEP